MRTVLHSNTLPSALVISASLLIGFSKWTFAQTSGGAVSPRAPSAVSGNASAGLGSRPSQIEGGVRAEGRIGATGRANVSGRNRAAGPQTRTTIDARAQGAAGGAVRRTRPSTDMQTQESVRARQELDRSRVRANTRAKQAASGQQEPSTPLQSSKGGVRRTRTPLDDIRQTDEATSERANRVPGQDPEDRFDAARERARRRFDRRDIQPDVIPEETDNPFQGSGGVRRTRTPLDDVRQTDEAISERANRVPGQDPEDRFNAARERARRQFDRRDNSIGVVPADTDNAIRTSGGLHRTRTDLGVTQSMETSGNDSIFVPGPVTQDRSTDTLDVIDDTGEILFGTGVGVSPNRTVRDNVPVSIDVRAPQATDQVDVRIENRAVDANRTPPSVEVDPTSVTPSRERIEADQRRQELRDRMSIGPERPFDAVDRIPPRERRTPKTKVSGRTPDGTPPIPK